ncbi:hypothetical protein NDU88_001064 [Pleurodeles waltl]|uniref:Uncharacterized protein n=1 Tax=Pleurodeles waltl TaxID=8319 RepID=A0AAV7LKB3_PLEWA|nr:hypothetical protein NDU88_001064 [Pleurodeles waltl]
MEDSHNAGPKECKADTDQALSNGKEHKTLKGNSIPTEEQAASLTGEIEFVMGLEQFAMVEGGDVPIEGAANKKYTPRHISRTQTAGGASHGARE